MKVWSRTHSKLMYGDAIATKARLAQESTRITRRTEPDLDNAQRLGRRAGPYVVAEVIRALLCAETFLMSDQMCASEHSYTGVAALLQLFDGNVEAVRSLLEAASRSIEVDLRRIEAGIAAGDALAVADAAHRLKGTSGSISARRLADISSSIERDARDRSLSRATALVTDLRGAVDSFAATIASYTSENVEGSPAPEAS